MTTTVEKHIDAIVEGSSRTAAFVPTDTSAWTGPFEARLPFRLPPSFLALIRRYCFPPLDCGGFTLFGNVDGKQRDDLTTAVFRDRMLASITQRAGLVQIGRPDFATVSYDLLCFDFRDRPKNGEARLVHLDHEEVLTNSRIRVLKQVSASFLEFLEELVG